MLRRLAKATGAQVSGLQLKLWLGVGTVLLVGFVVLQVHHYRLVEAYLADQAMDEARALYGLLKASRHVYHFQPLVRELPGQGNTAGRAPGPESSRFSAELDDLDATLGGIESIRLVHASAPDREDAAALEYFRQNPAARERLITHSGADGNTYLEYAAPIRTEAYCLECHGQGDAAPAAIGAPNAGGVVLGADDLHGVFTASLPYHRLEAHARGHVLETMLVQVLIFLALFLVGGALLQRLVLTKLGVLKRGTQALASGDYDARVSVTGNDELQELAGAFNTMAEAIASRERRLEAAQAFAGMGFWTYDPASATTCWSDGVAHIFGLPISAGRAGAVLVAQAHGDDREAVEAVLGRIVSERAEMSLDYRVVRTGGGERWVHLRGRPVTDGAGAVSAVEGFVQDVTERKREESRREESEALLRVAMDSARDAFVIIDSSDDTVVRWNPAAERAFGYGARQALGRSLHDLVVPESSRAAARAGLAGFRETGTGPAVGTTLELEALRQDGSTFPVELTVSPMRLQDRWYALGIARDISQRREDERRRAESETLFTRVFEASAAAMSISALETGVYERVNKAFAELTGFSPEEVIGRRSVDLGILSVEDRAALRRAVAHGPLGSRKLRMGTKAGEAATVLYTGEVIELEGQRRLLSIVQDITELERSQEALRRSEERFAMAMQGTNDGLFDWDLSSDAVYYSPRWKGMLGYREQELEDVFATWERLTEPGDREAAQAMMQDYMAGRRDDYRIEFRMRHRDGHWVDVLARALLVRGPDGEPVRVVGTHTDISEHKRAQRQIELERNRARQYLDLAGVMLVALDRDGRVTLVNPRACAILGYPEDAIIGRDWFEDFLPPGRAADLRSVFARIIAGDMQTVEYVDDRVLTADGSERTIAWHNAIIRDEEGRIVGSLSSGEDVTDARMAGEALNTERAFLQDLIDSIDDPIVVLGPDYRVLRKNRVARQRAPGVEAETACLKCQGMSRDGALPCSGAEDSCPLREVLASGSVKRVIHTQPEGDGAYRTLEVAASPLRGQDGTITGIIQTSRDISEQLRLLDKVKEQELSYAYLTQHDSLTGLPNRLLFTDRLHQAIHAAHRQGGQFAVLYVDLDHFKHLNESFDHSFGDRVLKAVAARLQRILREDDTIARLGGDEFGVILTQLHSGEDAGLIARKVLAAMAESFEVDDRQVFLGASIGISTYPRHGETPDELERNADAALFRAKDGGRGTFQYYTEDLTARAFERVLLEANLHQALERGELLLHYQPQFDLATGRPSGVEALVRWQHPEMGLVSPGKFIPIAEESGMIVPMGAWILGEACRQMQEWRQRGLVDEDAVMSVNLSGKQFDQPGLADHIGAVLEASGLAPRALELEVTETLMMQSPERAGEVLRRLRDLGVQVAVDDFGTGYSSLNYLKRLPLTKLKVDRSFVCDVPGDENDVAIVRAVIGLAHSLSLVVVAEGIETVEQRDFLLREGCQLGQGFLLARPMEAAALAEFLDARAAGA